MPKRLEKLSEKLVPRELDLDITGLRHARLADLRNILEDLNDLDIVERVLNGRMRHIATEASVTIRESGRNGHDRLLLPLPGEEPRESQENPPARKTRRRSKRHGPDNSIVQDQIMAILTRASKRGPVQSGHIRAEMRARFAPPYAAQSGLNRALNLLREAKRIRRIDPGPGRKYPTYAILDEEAPDKPDKPDKPARRRRATEPRGYTPKANSIASGVMYALTEGDAKGMTLPEITRAVEQNPEMKFLDGYSHGTQVSWALKGHRNNHRLETIERKDGTRIHRLLLPKISVTKG